MQCSRCRNEAIVYQPYSGQHLCRDHLIDDLEAKAKRAIRVHHGMRPGDRIGIPLTGDIAGEVLLFLLQKLTGNRRDIQVVIIPARNGDSGYQEGEETAGITKIAIATTLEDAAASGLTDILQGNVGRYFSSGISTSRTLPIIAPFSHIPAEEVAAYARVCGLSGKASSCGKESDTFGTEVAMMLIDYAGRHPAAPHAVVNLCESLAQVCEKPTG
jgi:hypothetical protein